MMHLSFTGVDAGVRLCGEPRTPDTQSVHAVYAPLHKPEFRQTCCPKCLGVWAVEAYEDEDEMPTWVWEMRKVYFKSQPTWSFDNTKLSLSK